MDHDDLHSRFDRIEDKLDKYSDKLDKYAEQAIESKHDIQSIRGTIKTGVAILTSIITAIIGYLATLFTGKA